MLVEAERLARLLNEMLDSSRHRPEESKRISLEPLTKDLLAITRYQIRAEVTLESHIDPQLHCLAPEGLLRQALLNLVLNSAAALPDEGGNICVSAKEESHRTLHANHGNGQWLRLPGRYSGAGDPTFSQHPGTRDRPGPHHCPATDQRRWRPATPREPGPPRCLRNPAATVCLGPCVTSSYSSKTKSFLAAN